MTPDKRILIVDDDENNLELYDLILKAENYIVIKARDGIEALDRFEKVQPDLVILDLMMPRLNGLEFCARLRHNPRARHVPILILTGLDEPETRQNALQQGATAFLAKPFKSDTFLQQVRTLLAPRA